MMKNIALPLATMLLLFTSLALGCKKDKELDREKFLATYAVVENCPSSGTDNYDITITASAASDNGIIISGFYGVPGLSITATVSGSSMTIPQQTVTFQGVAVNVSGSGTINGNSLTITYSLTIGAQGETCAMTCTKR
jgi:hypothetical protein